MFIVVESSWSKFLWHLRLAMLISSFNPTLNLRASHFYGFTCILPCLAHAFYIQLVMISSCSLGQILSEIRPKCSQIPKKKSKHWEIVKRKWMTVTDMHAGQDRLFIQIRYYANEGHMVSEGRWCNGFLQKWKWQDHDRSNRNIKKKFQPL